MSDISRCLELARFIGDSGPTDEYELEGRGYQRALLLEAKRLSSAVYAKG